MIKNFYIFRNGQSSHNLAGKLQGLDNNSVLTDKGISQALSTADYLKDKNIDIIISSPQRRAKQTGSIIAKKINTPIQYDSRLREVNLGEVDGYNINKLSAKNLEILNQCTNKLIENKEIFTIDNFSYIYFDEYSLETNCNNYTMKLVSISDYQNRFSCLLPRYFF